jgi:hypothetical protein
MKSVKEMKAKDKTLSLILKMDILMFSKELLNQVKMA